MNGGHYPASFDNKTETILVHQAAADRARIDNDESGELLVVLIHEFGHYIDKKLRVDLADKDANGQSTLKPDAELEEGAVFAYGVAFFDFSATSETIYAEYSSPTFTGPLRVNYHEFRELVKISQAEDAQRSNGKIGNVEFFEAGVGSDHRHKPNSSFGHQSIEFALRDSHNKFKDDRILKMIYFGNWLRDFSQVLDPAVVRKAGTNPNFSKIFTRKDLTDLVNVLAFKEFVDPRVKGDLALFKVTQELLGVYRPVEHIDNPTNTDPNAVDPRMVDPNFQAPATKAELAVDPVTSMKRYVSSSRDYMKMELNLAAAAGPSPTGYRHFGAALHVLEDYFAHSNFIELSLRKLGYNKVLPWTSPVPGRHPLPLVTGMFNPDDVIASTAGTIAELLFKYSFKYEDMENPSDPTIADKIVIVILKAHSQTDHLKTYINWMRIRTKIYQSTPMRWRRTISHYSYGMIATIHNFVYSTLLHGKRDFYPTATGRLPGS